MTKQSRFSFHSYDMMKSCWSLDSTKRPSFSELLESLEEKIKTKRVRVQLSPKKVYDRLYSLHQEMEFDRERAEGNR